MRKRKNRNNGFPWSGPAFNDRCNQCDPACKKSSEEDENMTNIAQGQDVIKFAPFNPLTINPRVAFNPLFHEYQRTPFDPSRQVKMRQDCHDWGARDLGFDGIQVREPVYAVESGTVISVNRNFYCYSDQPDPNHPGFLIPKTKRSDGKDCWAHMVVIRGSDGYFTEYAHVMPSPDIQVGKTVRAGTLIGNVDLSGPTSGPHVHFARWVPQLNWKYTPDPQLGFDITYRGLGSGFTQNGTCFWTMVGVPDIPFYF